MAKQKFTAPQGNPYGALIQSAENDTENTKDIENTNNTKNVNAAKGARPYTRLDPRKPAPAEYRFTARMPGEYGRFLNELAYQRRSTITAEIMRLVAEEMERRPEILESLDELND